LSSKTVEPVLRACCDRNIELHALVPETGLSFRGRFASLQPNAVQIELGTFEGISVFEPPALCLISFNLDNVTTAFPTRVLHLWAEGRNSNGACVLVALPPNLSQTARRLAYRIPVHRQCPLRAELSSGEQTWSLRVLDFSRCGAAVEHHPRHTAELATVTSAKLRLRMGNEDLQLEACPRWHDENRMGLFFPETVRMGEVDAQARTNAIAGLLERDWLQRRREQ
jgi:hypothetical protein